MNFQCPSCNIILQAEPESFGKAVKCPSCSTKIDIPADFGQTEAGDPSPQDAASTNQNHPELNLNYKAGAHPANINMWVAMGIGLAIAGLIYLVMFLIPSVKDAEGVKTGPWIKEFFLDRGPAQYASTILATWCIGILILKAISIQKQRRAMLIQALPQTISNEVSLANLKEFHDNLLSYPPKIRNSYLGNRIRKALECFYVRQNNSDVGSIVAAVSDVDANKVAGSYNVVKVFLWAIPIMGFIGTVLGIGSAIGGFADVLQGGSDGGMDQLKEGLMPVLGKMGMAFDTTLLALVLSIILAFPASALQGNEEDIINDVDLYCAENLMSRLDDGSAGNAQFNGDADLLRAVGEAMADNQKDVMDRFEQVQGTMSDNLSKQTENHIKVAETVDKQLEAIGERAEKYEAKLDDDIDKQVRVLAEGIQNLNAVLKELNGKQVVVKKKWFG